MSQLVMSRYEFNSCLRSIDGGYSPICSLFLSTEVIL
jgi:hypothetical protein